MNITNIKLNYVTLSHLNKKLSMRSDTDTLLSTASNKPILSE